MEDSPSLKHEHLMVVIWVGVAASVFFTILRVFIRLIYFRRLYVDDAFVVMALAILIASAVMYHFMAPTMYLLYALTEENPPPTDFLEKLIRYLKMQFAVTLLFWTCLWAVKFSFLAFFYKLGQGLRTQKLLWRVVLVFSIFAYLGCLISYPIACSSFVPGNCDSKLHIQRALVSLRYSTAIDIISDVMIIFLPVNLIWKVKINRKEKVALGSLFSLGVIIIAFAIVRVVKTNSTTKHPPPVWLALWSAIESSAAVIVSCLASFKTLFNRSGDSRYVNRSPGNGSYTSNKRGIPLVHQGQQHSVTVRGGAKNHASSMDSSVLDDDIGRMEAVHIKTDVEVFRSQ